VAYVTVDFDDGEPYNGNRPVGKVVLHGPGGPHGTTWTAYPVLVDTGADYMHLPDAAAAAVGLSLAGATAHNVSTAGGIVTVRRLTVQVEVHGILRKVPVNFAPNGKPLIGRQAMFAAIKSAGFSTTEWLREL
jgi:predicted aspartyl protease